MTSPLPVGEYRTPHSVHVSNLDADNAPPSYACHVLPTPSIIPKVFPTDWSRVVVGGGQFLNNDLALQRALPPSTEAIFPVSWMNTPSLLGSVVDAGATSQPEVGDYCYTDEDRCLIDAATAGCLLGFPDPASTFPSLCYASGSSASTADCTAAAQHSASVDGTLPFSASVAGSSVMTLWESPPAWNPDVPSTTVSRPRSPSTGSDPITVEVVGCDITLWDVFNLQAAFNSDGSGGELSRDAPVDVGVNTRRADRILDDAYVGPPSSPAPPPTPRSQKSTGLITVAASAFQAASVSDRAGAL